MHRLDRLTSGVLLFARTQAAAQRLFAQISDRDVHKQYLCRVRGVFPEYVYTPNLFARYLAHDLPCSPWHGTGSQWNAQSRY